MLGFDGGRADPYHIMESKGPFQGSIWLGNKGLHWTIGELRKLKHVSRSGIFQFRRDGYRTLEFSCLSNRGGRFVELSEYHGGAQRCSIRIPEGRRGDGWALFVTELQKYYLETESSKAPPKREGDFRGGRMTASESHPFRNGRISHNELRLLRREDPWLAPKIQLRDFRDLGNLKRVNDRVMLSNTEPRPTRSFNFKWRVGQKTIRVTKMEGQARSVSWVGTTKGDGPPRPTVEIFNPSKRTHGPEKPTPKHDIESRSDSDLEVEEGELNLGADSGEHAGEEIRADLDEGVVPEEEFAPNPPRPSGEVIVESGCDAMVAEEPSYTTELAMVQVDLAETIQGPVEALESESSLLSWYTQEEPIAWPSVTEQKSHDALVQGETEPISPMVCEPLAVVAPSTTLDEPGKSHKPDSARSEWVNTQYRGLCELVGFPLDTHEKQCLALLRRIEASRSRNKGLIGSRKVVCSGTKGARELRNLATSVNYEGRQRVCC